MRYLLISLCLFCSLGAKAQYTISADTSICLLQITNQNSQIRYSFELAELRYADRGGTTLIEIWDEASTVTLTNTAIWSHASFAALKTDLDRWAEDCRE